MASVCLDSMNCFDVLYHTQTFKNTFEFGQVQHAVLNFFEYLKCFTIIYNNKKRFFWPFIVFEPIFSVGILTVQKQLQLLLPGMPVHLFLFFLSPLKRQPAGIVVQSIQSRPCVRRTLLLQSNQSVTFTFFTANKYSICK